MKYLGIDYGTRRIGVAVSDEGAVLAFPLGVVMGGTKALQEVLDIARENGVGIAVIGESKDYSGVPNPIMEKVRAFAEKLEEGGLSVVYEPEYMTSVAAARQYAPDSVSPDGRKSRKEMPSQDALDSSAAALILQSYLDRRKQRPNVE